MGLEFELKYGATEQVQEEILQHYAQLQWQTYHMQTAYFDTPSGALSARKITLRCRMENGLPVCTVKTPAEGGRGEWELAGCDSVEKAIPALCEMGAPRTLLDLAREGLTEICGAEFTRRAATVCFEGAVMELALDSGFLVAGEKKLPLCEVEVERKDGETALTVSWATVLARRFGLQLLHKSKFRRALELKENKNG